MSKDESLLSCYGLTRVEQKKYPVVTDVLKQLTPERIKSEIEEVRKIELPLELQKWIKEYKKVGERDDYIWKWAYLGWQIFTFSYVDEKYRKSVIKIKMHSTMINVLVDDLADTMQKEEILIEALNIISNSKKKLLSSYDKNDRNYLYLIEKVWNLINKNIRQYPMYKDFEDIFKYDYSQFLNTMRYSYLINKNPALINLIEHELYSPHNMQMIIGSTIDLMCSPKFNFKNIGAFREISWNMQQMGRIGNLLNTWENEIYDNDFTSGVFAYALDKNIINAKDLEKKGNIKKIIKKITTSEAEKYYLKKWECCYNKIYNSDRKIKYINVEKILKGSKLFLIMHLTSRNLEIQFIIICC